MTSELFLQSLLNGVTLAAIYILVALGLTLLFSIMHILNFAHGELFMLGAYGIFFFMEINPTESILLNYLLGMIFVIVLVGLVGIGLEKIFFRPIRGKVIQGLILSMGLSMFIQGVTNWAFGITDRSISSVFRGMISFGGVSISAERLIMIAVSAFLVITLHFFVSRTKAGLAMRAIEQNPEGAALQGIRPDFTNSLAFFIAASLAAAAGILIAPIFIINPYMGSGPLLKAFMIIILGGIGSVYGCIAGGLVIGFMDSFVTVLAGSEGANAIGFSIVILVVLLRPKGILGHD
jgi:branched-chain amino acid transport system permease protein